MSSMKVSLLLCFLFFLHLQHHFYQAISRPTTSLATADPSHDNLPVQSVESKHEGDALADKTAELAVVVKKGGRGGGRGGRVRGRGRSFGGGGRSFGGGERSFGGGGRSIGGGGRSFGGGGRSYGGGNGERSRGGGGGWFPVYGGGGLHHGGHRSSGDRKSSSVWLGLSTLLGLVLYF